jgi:hypothetical protein
MCLVPVCEVFRSVAELNPKNKEMNSDPDIVFKGIVS